MKSLIKVVIMGLLTCVDVYANSVNARFTISEMRGSFYEIVAADANGGIIKLQSGQYHCYGKFELDKSYPGIEDPGHINIYFPAMGQRDYPGNCHNFSLSIDLKGQSPWELLIGQEVETYYKGIRSFGFLRETVLARLK